MERSETHISEYCFWCCRPKWCGNHMPATQPTTHSMDFWSAKPFLIPPSASEFWSTSLRNHQGTHSPPPPHPPPHPPPLPHLHHKKKGCIWVKEEGEGGGGSLPNSSLFEQRLWDVLAQNSPTHFFFSQPQLLSLSLLFPPHPSTLSHPLSHLPPTTLHLLPPHTPPHHPPYSTPTTSNHPPPPIFFPSSSSSSSNV